MHRTLRWLASRGHEVRAIVLGHRAYEVDGVKYLKRGLDGKHEWWRWADVAITQQGGTPSAVRFADDFSTPLLAYAHNLAYLDGHPELDPARHVLIANGHAALETFGWTGRALVLRPPVFAAEWSGAPGELVTQVNLSALKGGALFWDLVRRRPATKFLGVIGGWGEQLDALGETRWPRDAERHFTHPGNVDVIARTTNMLDDVYRRTRVLLVPTGRVNAQQVGESYGIVAAEALCSGIPVIARRSPGLEEVLGDAGTLLDTSDPDEWADALDALDAPGVYYNASAQARARAAEIDPTAELLDLEATLLDLADYHTLASVAR